MATSKSAETSPSESITLIIRTANNNHSDFDVTLSPSSSVLDLKRYIALNHPTKALPKDQRLIFSGKLLDDANILNQVFIKSTLVSHCMVHLVLSTDKNASTTKTPQQPTPIPAVIEKPSSSSTPLENLPTVVHSPTYEQYLQELVKYQQQLQQFMINPNGSPPSPTYGSQAYLQYCYTHYQMYQNLLASQTPIMSKPTPITSTSVPAATPSSPPPPPQAAPAPAPPAAAPANNNNNNIEFDQENDLLGTLHMLAELFVLCSIIYFYSTFNRFLVVFVIFVLLYMHCRGYLSLQRRRRAQVQVPAAAAAAEGDQQQEQQPAPPGDAEQQVAEDEPETEVAPPLTPNEPQNLNDLQRPQPPPTLTPVGDNQISTARLLVTAVSTFFSSLIPERPQRL